MEPAVRLDLPFTFLPFGFLAIILLVLVIVLAVYQRDRRLQQEVAERGQRVLPRCPICGGITESGQFLYSRNAYAYRLRSGGRTYPIGVVRCTQCGHVDLFASEGDALPSSNFPMRL